MMEKIHDTINNVLWKTRIRRRRSEIKSEHQLILKEVQNHKDKTGGGIPDESDPIWVRLSSLQASYVELRWQKRKKKLNLSHPRSKQP